MKKNWKRLFFLSLFLLSSGWNSAYARQSLYTIDPVEDQSGIVGETLSFRLHATNAISYQAILLPGGANLNNLNHTDPRPPFLHIMHGDFTWIPKASDVGIHTVSFYAVTSSDVPCVQAKLMTSEYFLCETQTTAQITVKITVVPRSPPVFDSALRRDYKVTIGQRFQLRVTAKKADGKQASQITMSRLEGVTYPEDAFFDTVKQNFYWTPKKAEDAGKTFGVRFMTSEGGPSDKPAILDLKIIVSAAKPPKFREFNDQTISVGNTLTLDIGAHREDTDFSRVNNYDAGYLGPVFPSDGVLAGANIPSLPPNGSIDRDQGILTFTPYPSDAGKVFKIRLTASSKPPAQLLDNRTIGRFSPVLPSPDTVTKDISITVPVMKPPIFEAIGDQVVLAGQELSFGVSAKGEDGLKVTNYTAQQVPDKTYQEGFIFERVTGLFTLKTLPTWPAKEFYVRFGLAQWPNTYRDVKISIVKTKSPPVFVNENNIFHYEVSVGNELAFVIAAKDPDGGSPPGITMSCEDPRFSGANAPLLKAPAVSVQNPGAAVSKTFSWTPNSQQIGTYRVMFTAKDNESEIVQREYTIKVMPNQPPTISPIPDQTIAVGKTLTFDVIAGDPDGGITMPVVRMQGFDTGQHTFPDGAKFEIGESSWMGQFSWTPARNQAGKYAAIFVASDGITYGTQEVQINVINEIFDRGPNPGQNSPILNSGKPPISELPPGFTSPVKNSPDKSSLPIKPLPIKPVIPNPPKDEPPSPDPSQNSPLPQPPPSVVEPSPKPTPQIVTPDKPRPEEPKPAPQSVKVPASSEPELPVVSHEFCTANGKTKNMAEVAKSMEGVWDSRTWGTVYAKAIGSRLEGTYTAFFGRFEAFINSDCDIEGRWREFQIMPGGDKAGTFKMKTIKNSDGEYMQKQYDDAVPGKVMTAGWGWRKFDSTDTPEPDWYLKSINPGRSLTKGYQHVVCPGGDTCSSEEMNRIAQAFAGRWETNHGDIEATASGISIQGTLAGSGKISGTVQPDGTIKGRWKLSPDSHGEYIFWIDPIAKNVWGKYNSDSDPGVWDEGWQAEKIN